MFVSNRPKSRIVRWLILFTSAIVVFAITGMERFVNRVNPEWHMFGDKPWTDRWQVH